MTMAFSNLELLILQLALVGLFIALAWWVTWWVKQAPVTPDPWDIDTEKKLDEPETSQACHHCSTPLSPTAWFCPHCGSAVGPYNNVMPYVHIFSEGEVFRNGMDGRFRNRPLVLIGYMLLILPFPLTLAFALNSRFGLIFGSAIVLVFGIRIFQNLTGLQQKSPDQN